MWTAINQAISEATGQTFAGKPQAGPGGGCISEASKLVDARSGQSYFVKRNGADKAHMFATEAAGLQAMAATQTIRVPRPICHGLAGGHAFLVLEWIEMRSTGSWSKLGSQLADLHLAGGVNDFGWDHDNYIGATPQSNRHHPTWVTFYIEERLEPLVQQSMSLGAALPNWTRLRNEIPQLLADHEVQPALVHGDLWSGNVGFDEAGEPVIYDPAVYFGDGEVDLAMSRLFGAFGAPFDEAYRQKIPADPGVEQRETLYNLYHILNHYILFGGGYGHQAAAMMARLL